MRGKIRYAIIKRREITLWGKWNEILIKSKVIFLRTTRPQECARRIRSQYGGDAGCFGDYRGDNGGAMIGYRYAMERIMNNSIITGVRARAVVIGQQRVLGHPLNLSEFHPDTEKDLIYGHFEVKAFNNYVYEGEESQALEVYNIPKRVCEKIQDTEFPDVHITLVNREEVGDTPRPCIPDGPTENTGGIHDADDYFTAEYHNTVTFIFMNLGTEACEDDSDCLICQACSEGFCHYKGDGAPCDNPAGGCCAVGQCRPGDSRSCQCTGYVPQSGEHVCSSRGYQDDPPEWSC